MKKFDIPDFYSGSIISRLKEIRKSENSCKENFSPTEIDLGPVKFLIARHFGFCYGVKNAVDIAYKTINENPGKRIFLLSEMIHNPLVNLDLQSRGIKFVMDVFGNQLIEWKEITSKDIVIIPAFGTTLETENLLKEKNIDPVKFNTTCPFVKKVWKRAKELGDNNFTVIIHGKAKHEETRATFSHSKKNAPSLIIHEIEEAEFLSKAILEEINETAFNKFFEGKYSEEFDFANDLKKIGVVNQTTMLASETMMISDLLRNTMVKKYGTLKIKEHFADTHDTLCYATNDNQSSAVEMLNHGADFAIVVGGYNSSNTSHLAELLEEKYSTYFISGAEKLISKEIIQHFDIHSLKEIVTEKFLPVKEKITSAITCGASCPDSIMDEVLNKLISFFDVCVPKEALWKI